jgi:hypothetical protein
VAVSLGDPDTILLTSSRTAREAHTKASANSFVYRRSSGEPCAKRGKGFPLRKGAESHLSRQAQSNLMCSTFSPKARCTDQRIEICNGSD